MDIDDFRCLRRGNSLFCLDKKDTALLAPIEHRNGKKRRALLLIHGFTSTPAVFRTLIPSLSFYDAIVCPVLPGHAHNLEAFARAKAAEWLLLAEQYGKILTQEFEHVDVLGLSLGGLLACHLSNRFNINHLYLLAPALDLRLPLDRTLRFTKFLNWLGFKEIRSFAGNLYTDLHCEIAYRKLPLTSIIEIFTLIKQFQFITPHCPTDLFLGCHDLVVSSWRVAARFANKKDATIHWLANSAHVIPLDGDIEKIIACMKQNCANQEQEASRICSR
ncbi:MULTISPECIES: carboxylesterase [unclassified Legionella]|uniref:alpha/beta hydrolase n=1 Tax=unclassified Legionella TaxID=2622702 RepID=UPI0010551CE9|nr:MULTISPECIES: alpha/beta fold hydrolase [unclassified Legionella]MDI9819655.1 alpha/beta fold hydrolase [Legionella sp. PL877]